MTDTTPTALPRTLSPSLFLYSIVYGGMVVLAGVLGNKQVALGDWLAVEAGIFAFLMLVALSSAVSELHGQAVANRIVLWGFVPLVLSIMLTALVLALPASPEMQPERLASFDMILGQSPRLMAAGIVAYGTSQFLNVTIFSKLRGREGAGSGTTWLAIRGAIASALSQIVDTLLFVTIAFYGVFPIANLMGGQMLAKVALSVLVIPFVITGLVALGRSVDAKNGG
ncbi:queuosine precursor transporter [Sphingopyxis kveilinensis]|uniref:queuosine precursor transporter n=1 Tax=Sphingopyxis kveilinensis TaxID=3114367 RepID=UPI0030CD20CE